MTPTQLDDSSGHLIPVDLVPDDPGGPAGPAVPAPSHAERARTLAADATRGALSTLLSGRSGGAPAGVEGFPYSAVANVVVDEVGAPTLFVSTLAPHTQHLRRDPRAAVLLSEQVDGAADTLAAARVCLIGTMGQLARGTDAFAAARDRYLSVHPRASYVDYHDFECHRLSVEAVRYIGGFGRMSWVEATGYAAAEPDPLRVVAPGAVAHLNDDHAGAVLDCVRAFGALPDAVSATVQALDRYGMDVLAGSGPNERELRLAFLEPVDDPAQLRKATVVLTRRARELLTQG